MLRSISLKSIPIASRPLSTSLRNLKPIVRCYSSSPLSILSDEESMFRDSVASFASQVIAPKVRDMDEAESMDPEVIKSLFEMGLMGIETPENLGGAGASFTSAILTVEELAKVDPSVAVLNDVQNTLVNTCIRKWGSDALKKKYLPQLATEKVGSFALSESVSGSDAFALKSRAVKKDGGYYLTGSKMWITNSFEADVFIVFANLNPDKGYKGITAFVLDKSQGIKIAKKEKKLGIRASSTCVIDFDEVFVPEEDILGEEGKGYKIAIECLNEGRIGIAAQMLGLAQGAFNRSTSYIYNDRKQFGKYIGDFQGIQFQVAEAATKIEAARNLVYNAARMQEAGLPFVKEAAMAKLYTTEIAQEVASKSLEWMGGVGFTREEILEKFYRDAKIGVIYEGTSNIQRQTIAKFVEKEVKQ